MDFPVVFIFYGDFHPRQTTAEAFRQKLAVGFRPIGVSAPTHIHLAEIIHAFPVFCFQQGPHSGAVTAGRTTKYAVAGLGLRFRSTQPALFQFGGFSRDMFSHEILFRGFLLRRRQRDRLVHPLDGERQRIPEQPANTDRHVDTGPFQFRRRDEFQPNDPAATLLPNRPNAKQIKELGDALPATAHIGAAPHHHADTFRIMPFLRHKPFDQ